MGCASLPCLPTHCYAFTCLSFMPLDTRGRVRGGNRGRRVFGEVGQGYSWECMFYCGDILPTYSDYLPLHYLLPTKRKKKRKE